jgi:hypothetical protein
MNLAGEFPSEESAIYSRCWLVPVLCDPVGVEIASGGITSDCFGGTDPAQVKHMAALE